MYFEQDCATSSCDPPALAWVRAVRTSCLRSLLGLLFLFSTTLLSGRPRQLFWRIGPRVEHLPIVVGPRVVLRHFGVLLNIAFADQFICEPHCLFLRFILGVYRFLIAAQLMFNSTPMNRPWHLGHSYWQSKSLLSSFCPFSARSSRFAAMEAPRL